MSESADPTRTASPCAAEPVATATFAAPPQPYTDHTPYAHGGLGEVFRATDPVLNRTVAVKRLLERRSADPDSRRRFLVEAEVTARLEHPGVVPVYGLFTDDRGGPAYAMRFVQGPTLWDALKAYHAGAPDPGAFRRLLQSFLQVCQTVAYAHTRGVIHRDLKPQNVLLGKFGETLVVDWGLAKVVGRPEDARTEALGEETLVPGSGGSGDETAMGSAVGTPAFMSPEQAAGRWNVIDHRSDVYGLGAVLYTVLTGLAPLDKGDWPEMQQKIQRGDVPAPRSVKPDVPRPLEAVCRKAMAVRPEDRYPSAADLAADVEHWLVDEPTSAYREPAAVRVRRWAKRNRTAVAAATVLLVTALAAAGVGLVALGKKNAEVAAERNAARTAADEAEAVNTFLTDDLLGQADPDLNARDKKVTVEEVLTKAAAKIDGNPKFADKPLVEASLRLAVGKTYDRLSKYAEAERQLRRAMDLRRAHLPPDDPRTLDAQDAVARVLTFGLGRHADAELIGRQTWEARKRVFGANHRTTLQSLEYYAWAETGLGRHDEALALMRECLAGRRAAFDPDDEDCLSSMNNIAILLGARGEWGEAIELLRGVVRFRERKPVAYDGYAPAANLGLNLYYLGELNEAETILARYADHSIHHLGPDHAYTHYIRATLAWVWAENGKPARAVETLDEVIAARRKEYPNGDWRTASYLTALGNAKLAEGKPDGAAAALEEARSMYREFPPQNAYYAPWADVCHGTALLKLGRPDAAEPLLLAAEQRLRGMAACPKRHYRQTVDQLVALYDGRKDAEQAARWRTRLAGLPPAAAGR